MESNKENFSEILGLKQEEMNENQKKPWNFEYKDKNMKIRELLEQQITQMDQTIKTLIRLNKVQTPESPSPSPNCKINNLRSNTGRCRELYSRTSS
jgi:hypothetical protein